MRAAPTSARTFLNEGEKENKRRGDRDKDNVCRGEKKKKNIWMK